MNRFRLSQTRENLHQPCWPNPGAGEMAIKKGPQMKIVRLAAAAALLGMLASCASLGLPSPKTPRQAVFAADGAFLAAVTIANDYKALPDCGGSTPICKDPAVVEKIKLGANAADATLKAAENTVKDPNFGGSTSDSAIVAATNAVQAFVTITSALKTH